MNSRIANVINGIVYLLLGLGKFENKLVCYNGYRKRSILTWSRQIGLSWLTKKKLLNEIKIYSAPEIRSIIGGLVEKNVGIFSSSNCFIADFGDIGGSGGVVLYDFKHTYGQGKNKFIKAWEVPSLPPGSNIIFVDDIIATGSQAISHINNHLDPLLNASYTPYLLCLCGTPEGIKRIEDESNFKVLCGQRLEERVSQYYHEECRIFNNAEKKSLQKLNCSLRKEHSEDFDMGLLLAFYYSIPNSTMPIVWKEGFPCKTKTSRRNNWFALLPRRY